VSRNALERQRDRSAADCTKIVRSSTATWDVLRVGGLANCDSVAVSEAMNQWLVAGAGCYSTPGGAQRALLAIAYPGLMSFNRSAVSEPSATIVREGMFMI